MQYGGSVMEKDIQVRGFHANCLASPVDIAGPVAQWVWRCVAHVVLDCMHMGTQFRRFDSSQVRFSRIHHRPAVLCCWQGVSLCVSPWYAMVWRFNENNTQCLESLKEFSRMDVFSSVYTKVTQETQQCSRM